MIPLKDDVPSATVPYVTIGLIGLNVLVFLYQASIGIGGDPRAAEAFVFEFGATPCRRRPRRPARRRAGADNL